MDIINQNSSVIIAALAISAFLIFVLVIWRAFSQKVRGRQGQRLGISEYLELDQSRRLVLVRRDNVEHLVLIGGPLDVVVESGIAIGGQSARAPTFDDQFDTPSDRAMAIRPAPRAPTFVERRQAPLRTVEREDTPLAPVPPARTPDK